MKMRMLMAAGFGWLLLAASAEAQIVSGVMTVTGAEMH